MNNIRADVAQLNEKFKYGSAFFMEFGAQMAVPW